LVLDDSRDFTDNGSITIAGTAYAYTGNTRSTNTLTGFTAFSAAITVDSDVWQGVSFGTPYCFTVNDGYVYFDIPPDSTLSGRNIWLDYYTQVMRHNSDGDEISVNDPQLLISWLEMAIKKEKANGSLSPADISFIEYNRRKQLLVRNELSGQRIRLVPNVPERTVRPFSWWR